MKSQYKRTHLCGLSRPPHRRHSLVISCVSTWCELLLRKTAHRDCEEKSHTLRPLRWQPYDWQLFRASLKSTRRHHHHGLRAQRQHLSGVASRARHWLLQQSGLSRGGLATSEMKLSLFIISSLLLFSRGRNKNKRAIRCREGGKEEKASS